LTTEPGDLDYALLRRLARGQEEALTELIRRYQHRLYNLAYRILRDPLEAEDALQEVFLKVHAHAAGFEPRQRVSAWLYRITSNHCLNRLRQRRPEDSLDDGGEASLAAPIASPLEALQEQELSRRLETLLAQLPENQRQALTLKQFGGLSYQEIGTELGLSADAVDGLIKRARQFLKKALREYLE
jgi:RNA polymerase sigma-70 factor (ECF subfamily)